MITPSVFFRFSYLPYGITDMARFVVLKIIDMASGDWLLGTEVRLNIARLSRFCIRRFPIHEIPSRCGPMHVFFFDA